MNITGFTVCVGDQYANMLSRSFPIWKSTLDHLVVVTDRETEIPFAPKESIFRTSLFTDHGASFNKGAALSAAFAQSTPHDWVLNFDADIIPPTDWGDKLPREIHAWKLHGCSHRYGENGAFIPDADFPNIWGFFHLWNVASPYSWRRPVFDSTCGHAGNYDHTFMRQWPEDQRVDLWPELELVHQGLPRQRWFGRDPKNQKKMRALFLLGLWDAWNLRVGHIIVPPHSHICIDSDAPAHWIFEQLENWTLLDPFAVEVRIGNNPTSGEVFISWNTPAVA